MKTIRAMRVVLVWFFIVMFLMSCLSSAKESFAMTVNESVNNFTFNTAKIIREKSGEYFFSPYSILSAFGMAYAGAEGNTAREIEEALGFSKDFHSEFGNYIKEIEAEDAFNTANRIWLRNGLTLKDIYKDILLINYGSTAKELDFKGDTENSRKTINKWVSDKTKEKIPELLQKLEPSTQMILTNAVYFHSGWESKFDKSKTSKEKFFPGGCEVSEVDMMKKYASFLYAERDGNKIIRIPYEDPRFSMIIFLPPKVAGYSGTLETDAKFIELDAETFNDLVSSMREYDVDLWLPKFKVEKKYELKNLFDSLGIKLAFSDSADFSGITDDEKLKIDAVIHQTFIDLDEEKTEAAAATAIVMVKATALPPKDKPKAVFHADSPFEYFIVDDYTRTILFAGRQTF
ncbi:MAG: serpin family protein [Synergistaceae bacterium]|nr:serpin family protein [Synergistaceae bacterium]